MVPATNSRVQHPRGARLLLPSVLALVLTGIAATSAYTTLGKPFPSLVVDAYHFYSIVELPSWERTGSLPHMSHRLVAVNGEALPKEAPLASPLELYELMAGTSRDSMAHLEFEDPRGRSLPPISTRVSRFGAEEFLFFFVAYALAAWLVLWSGGLVFTVSGRPAARRAYTFWSVVTFLLLLSFYDYHTNAWLAPFFSVAAIGIPLGALWLAYAFPRPPQWRATDLRRGLIALTVLGAATAVGLIVARFTGWNIHPIRSAIDQLMAPSFVTLAGVVLLRMRRSTGLDRTELVTASWGLITTPLLLALVHVLTLFTGRDVRHLVLPFVVLLFPLSIGFAMVRNNILEAQTVLTSRMLRVPFTLGAILLSVLGTYLAWLATWNGQVVLKLLVLLGFAIFLLLMVLARHLQTRLFFPATLAFRSTVEGLSDRLAALRDIPAIQRAVEEVVVKTLPTLSAQVVEPGALVELSYLPIDSQERLARGENLWTAQSPREQHLLIPMRSLGELRAVLLVAPKRGAALYTQEDIHLLETLASLGALALHNAEVVQELESIRRLEVGAVLKEKQLTLSALSEELCHEMVYPLNFLQDLLRRGASGQPLDEEDLSFARDEVDRMKRMLDSLRRLQLPTPRLAPLQLLGYIQRALLLVREPIHEKKLSVTIDVPPELTVTAEGGALVQLLSNLLRNAAQATPEAGAIGIRLHQGPAGQLLDVWDTGPGIPEHVAPVLFTSRRISTKPGGYGIGLTVVQRIAYTFRWDISFQRESERTLFRLTLPHLP
ncbi:HAMP domain-containing histidine kinase [Archangium violaceum]|uniref:ATP-binding protein n=1 Tax=Archangium violaceum TaxID=83451 RepID=UPI002B2D6319|nr:HAMP domain-containing histidine kinase [Archangium violaceum]